MSRIRLIALRWRDEPDLLCCVIAETSTRNISMGENKIVAKVLDFTIDFVLWVSRENQNIGAIYSISVQFYILFGNVSACHM